MIRIGIDVGGTNTDAVVVDGRRVVAGVKRPTSEDIVSGIVGALAAVLAEAQISPDAVDAVMIGTTHFTNAVVERKSLAPTAAIRLGLPATASLPPMVDWPDDLRAMLGDHVWLAHGGNEFDGRPISELDALELRGIAAEIAAREIKSLAITSVFSPASDEVERQAAAIMDEVVPGVEKTLSSQIGRIGLLERENAAIMNACLRPLSAKVVTAFRDAIAEAGVHGRFYLTQNDGTLMDADFAERFPVLTFASGPTNSMRGAAFLSGLSNAIVVDIGGTTADVGLLQKGFPRPASMAVEVGGVRTNFRMPEVFSIGLGGGSLISADGGHVGPRSVGYRLTQEALVFGGETLTATDIVVAAGRAKLGDPGAVAGLDEGLVAAALRVIDAMLSEVVDEARIAPDPLPVIVVGGGSILAQGPLGGLEVVKPPHFAVANAVGAAIAQVSGEVDTVVSLMETGHEAALAEARARAIGAAEAAGAAPGTVEVVDVEDVPVAYLPGNATRIRVKAVGDLNVG